VLIYEETKEILAGIIRSESLLTRLFGLILLWNRDDQLFVLHQEIAPDDSPKKDRKGVFYLEIPLVAFRINCTISVGWDTSEAWLEGSEMVVAFISLANIRSTAGGITWSFSDTWYHVGSCFQAGGPDFSFDMPDTLAGFCTAARTLAWAWSTSWTKKSWVYVRETSLIEDQERFSFKLFRKRRIPSCILSLALSRSNSSNVNKAFDVRFIVTSIRDNTPNQNVVSPLSNWAILTLEEMLAFRSRWGNIR